MPDGGRYWFPAQRHGWGLPITWQGWGVFLAFVGLIVAGAVLDPTRRSVAGFVVYVVLLGLLFTGVCWWKGEPTRWRWRDE